MDEISIVIYACSWISHLITKIEITVIFKIIITLLTGILHKIENVEVY